MKEHLCAVAVWVMSMSFTAIGAPSAVAGQSPQSTSGATPKLSGNASPERRTAAKDFQQFLAYWTAEAGWHSELQLRNNLPGQDLSVSPVLRTADGAETSLPVVTIKPAAVKSIDIVVSAPQLAGKYGSVCLRYHSVASRSLYASLMIGEMGHPITFHLDGTEQPENYENVSREGIWWLPNETAADYLIITNQGGSRIRYRLSVYDSAGKESKQALSIGPRQTSRFSVRQIIRSAGLSGSYGGIKIQAGLHAGSVNSIHFIFDEQAGFSALLKMFDYDQHATVEERDLAKAGRWTLRAPMLALSEPDRALGFPSSTVLHPQLFIRNTTAKATAANLRFIWRTQSTTGKASGPELSLGPFETRRIDVGKLQDGRNLPKDASWTSVVLTTKGQPDEVMAVATSYDETLRYGAQTPFSDQLSFKWEGSQWEYDVQHDSIITGGNGGTKPTRAAFTIFYNEGTARYELEQTLQPDEQMWIDVGRLIRERVPDKNGKTLPVDLASGSYEFRNLTDPGNATLFEGKVIYDKTYGHVAYGCGGPCCDDNPYVQFNPLGVPFLGNAGQGIDVPDNCGGIFIGDNSPFYGNWSTASTSIATVDYYAKHSGVGVGSTTSSTYGTLSEPYGRYMCSNQTRSAGGPDNVAKLSCTSPVTRGGTTQCTVTGPSGTTVSGWTFVDGGNNTVQRSTNATSLSWSGVMVTSGTVSVTVGGEAAPQSASITVNRRSGFTFNAVSPTSENNNFSGDGCTISVPSPPQQTGDAVGKFCLAQYFSFNTAIVGDNGPNNGYSYVTSVSSKDASGDFTAYFYVISPDLENSSSAFYKAQCGNYSSSAKTGFISGSNLLADTTRHESGTVESHYENYIVAQDKSANNLGTVAEAATGLESAQTLANSLTTTLNANRSTILSATQVEPCGVQYNANCTFQGCINFSPYHSCSQVVSCSAP